MSQEIKDIIEFEDGGKLIDYGNDELYFELKECIYTANFNPDDYNPNHTSCIECKESNPEKFKKCSGI